MAKSQPKARARKSVKQRSPFEVLQARTADMHGNQKRRAREHGVFLPYGLDDLRRAVRQAVDKGTCPYCQGRLTPANFGGDHKVPVSRAGSWELHNLVVCCQDCNKAKGPLDHVEWRELLQLLDGWSPAVKKHTLARLKAGAALIRGGISQPAGPPELTAAQAEQDLNPLPLPDSDYDD